MRAARSPPYATLAGSGIEGSRLARDRNTIAAGMDVMLPLSISLKEYTIIRISRTPGVGDFQGSLGGGTIGLNMYQMRSTRNAVCNSKSRRWRTLTCIR